jgi:hypothetical protein
MIRSFDEPTPGDGVELAPCDSLLPKAVRVRMRAGPEGLTWQFEPGLLKRTDWLTLDLITCDEDAFRLRLRLHARDGKRAFSLGFALLPNAQARLRLPMAALGLDRWMLPREGALLKPLCGGEAVEPGEVAAASLCVERSNGGVVEFHMTASMVVAGEPPVLTQPRLIKSPLVDCMGQSLTRSWAGRTRDVDELRARLRGQLAQADSWQQPESFGVWGGWKHKTFESTGFFRTQHDGRRWWLVDPSGAAFWSTGPDCCVPRVECYTKGLEHAVDGLDRLANNPAHDRRRSGVVNPLSGNFHLIFGDDWKPTWDRIVAGELKRLGFNTIGNWSDWRFASAHRIPYVRALKPDWGGFTRIFRDMPDVFDPAFAEVADQFARQLVETCDDPAMIGYFLMNEPTWGFAEQSLARGMLLSKRPSFSRRALIDWLKARYVTNAQLAEAWQSPGLTFDDALAQAIERPLGGASTSDLEAFSTQLVQRLFRTLSNACRRVDRNHLNLGARYHTAPPVWALAGMNMFDVFGMNGYAAVSYTHLTLPTKA